MEKIVFVLATIAIFYAVISFVHTVIDDYKLQKTVSVSDVTYKAMCVRLRSVEDDKRANTGKPISKEQYLAHAQKMNNTKFFEWINSPQNQNE